ncbi:MBL fold metallo-hydrolase [Pseudaminobacter sp. 19-2017]|uniref:MBL fold metallo-hydrolase n=1 Tax=Pseudaminobacter soli (ex Zhang et al. 2022) TaxID=2831468 RepID=A0A942E0M5_9HYPH|nr:MBL fold metallo-hydrolase [Pseudaminobacter soli]
MQKPVAEFWYGIEACHHNVLRLRETWIDPYLAGNIWLVRGSERDLVIDAGTGIVSPRLVIDSMVNKPVLAVACACYYDHAGGLHYFAERGCHRLDADQIANPTDESSVVSTYVSEAMLTALPYDGFEAANYRMQGAPPTVCFDDGDIIDLGDRRLEVLHVPGVTPGSMVLWEAATGSLFTCDTLYDDPVLERDFAVGDPITFADTLERLRGLPVNTVFAGHYQSFGRERMLELIDRILRAKRAQIQ